MTPTLLTQIRAARRVSVPLVAITTPDPAATMRGIVETVNGGPMLAWDVVEGVRAMNEEAKTVRAAILGEDDTTIGNPVALLMLAKKLPPKSVLFVQMAHRLIADPMAIQAAWNLRDQFKRDQRMLVLLSMVRHWPAELAGDVVTLDEPLPDAEALRRIIEACCSSAALELSENFRTVEMPRAVEAVTGLSAFAAEQVVAMSLTKKGCDIPALWERKRQQIEQTPGLKVSRDATRFQDIGGVAVVKQFLADLLTSKHGSPNAIVFIDEIEKFLAGAGAGGADSSGVSQDQLGTLLAYMQDQNAAGMIFVGPPGAAKSAVAKAAGNEAGIPTIQLDLGGMKGSLVGQSEQNLRAALKVITAVSNGKNLWIATCNAISELPPELRRRFTLGTFFFDLPDQIERDAIWTIWLKRFGISPEVKTTALINGRSGIAIYPRPNDDGWTGAEIRQCCDIAWRLGCSLKDAAAFVVPVSRSAAEQVAKLRRAAEGRFLSASRPSVYRQEQDKPAATDRRRMELEES